MAGVVIRAQASTTSDTLPVSSASSASISIASGRIILGLGAVHHMNQRMPPGGARIANLELDVCGDRLRCSARAPARSAPARRPCWSARARDRPARRGGDAPRGRRREVPPVRRQPASAADLVRLSRRTLWMPAGARSATAASATYSRSVLDGCEHDPAARRHVVKRPRSVRAGASEMVGIGHRWGVAARLRRYARTPRALRSFAVDEANARHGSADRGPNGTG